VLKKGNKILSVPSSLHISCSLITLPHSHTKLTYIQHGCHTIRHSPRRYNRRHRPRNLPLRHPTRAQAQARKTSAANHGREQDVSQSRLRKSVTFVGYADPSLQRQVLCPQRPNLKSPRLRPRRRQAAQERPWQCCRRPHEQSHRRAKR
jgi:hypothetical protein